MVLYGSWIGQHGIMDQSSARLRKLIDSAQRIVVFTGAGISTESGIPDFRSPGGIWSRLQPIEFQDFLSSEEMRRESWRRKIEIDSDMQRAKPNRGHRAVAHLVAEGRCSCVITQNIDGLHQESGIDDERLVELHGNGTYASCLECGRRHELAPIVAAFQRDETLPTCTICGGVVKTATISFGQPMPQAAMDRAQRETLACDLFLAIGSSLVVYPAAGFPALAKRNGATLVIVNRDPTELDPLADLVLNSEIGPTLGTAVGIIG
jgi:NAD-dependent deacetylase